MLLTSQTAKESIHTIDNIENDLEPKQNFKYYEVHDIHLLKDTIDINKQTSLLHTNICSLQANGDKLDILLKELDFKFDIIALSETWNPENKNHMFSPLHLEGYNNLTGTTGTTLKSGAGMYISNYINRYPGKISISNFMMKMKNMKATG